MRTSHLSIAKTSTLTTALTIAFLLATSFPTFAQKVDTVKPELVGISSDSLAKMNTYFHNLVDDKRLAGIQTAILRRGKLVHFDSYGYSNIQENTPLDEQSIFRIFSMTKPIVSVALMKLYEEGKFKLDDPLHTYIPQFKEMFIYTESGLVPAKNPIRIIDLLTHTSGFNYGRGQNSELNQLYAEAQLYTATTNKEFVDKLSTLPLQFEPGTNWVYGLSTNICGYLIEVLSGKSLDAYLKENILDPLDMKDTHFQLPQEKTNQFTVGYRWQAQSGLTISEQQRNNRYTRDVTLYNGGGGLVSTSLDYLKFCEMLLNKGKANGHRILKEETVELILSDHLQEARNHQERLRLPLGDAGFGLGFSIRGENENNLESVFGWGGAVGTYFRIDTQNELAYVMMIQLSPHRQLRLRPLFQGFVDASIIE